jgi:hypothetical protein
MIHSPEIMPLWGGAPSWTQVALLIYTFTLDTQLSSLLA